MPLLAKTYGRHGRTREAVEPEEEKALERSTKILGETALITMGNLASTYRLQGRSVKAAALQNDILEKRRRILGEEHPSTLIAMANLASTYWQQGLTMEAARLEEEVLQKRKRILGKEHPETLQTRIISRRPIVTRNVR